MQLRHQWFPISWALIIAFLHAIPGRDLPKPFWEFAEFDKLIHMGMFAVFAFTMAVGYFKSKGLLWPSWKVWLSILSICLIYGLVLELLQSFIFVGRFFDWSDVLADFIGVGFAFILFRTIYGRLRKLVLQ